MIYLVECGLNTYVLLFNVNVKGAPERSVDTKTSMAPLFLVQSNGKGKWTETDSDWQGPLQGPTGWHVPWSTGVGFSWAAAEGNGSQENLGVRPASLTHSRHIMEGWDSQIQKDAFTELKQVLWNCKVKISESIEVKEDKNKWDWNTKHPGGDNVSDNIGRVTFMESHGCWLVWPPDGSEVRVKERAQKFWGQRSGEFKFPLPLGPVETCRGRNNYHNLECDCH